MTKKKYVMTLLALMKEANTADAGKHAFLHPSAASTHYTRLSNMLEDVAGKKFRDHWVESGEMDWKLLKEGRSSEWFGYSDDELKELRDRKKQELRITRTAAGREVVRESLERVMSELVERGVEKL